MRNSLSVPDKALEYALLQRTALQTWNLKRFRKLHIPYYPTLCRLECRFRKEAIVAGYLDLLVDDYRLVQPFLPERAHRILDIGCGVAGIDVLLNDHYRSSDSPPQFALLDKTSIDGKIFYGFHQQGAFYNSLQVARDLLEANGVSRASVTLLPADDDARIDLTRSVDLVISLISWGFHYPVQLYLKEVDRVLAPGGSVILDVRHGTRGRQELDSHFRQTQTIFKQQKFDRILARK